MVSQTTHVIGAFVPSLMLEHSATILREAAALTREKGALLAISATDALSPTKEQVVDALYSLLDRSCDGVIALCPQLDASERDELRKLATNIVFLDVRLDSSADSLSTATHCSAGATAAQVLRERGHRRVMILTRASHAEESVVSSFLQAFETLRTNRSAVATVVVPTDAELDVAVSSLVRDAADWTTVFCTDPRLAESASRRLEAAGILVPGNISILSYDPRFLLSPVQIDSIQPELTAMTRPAVGALLNTCYGTSLHARATSLTSHRAANTLANVHHMEVASAQNGALP